MPAPAYRRDNGSHANVIMFTRKMSRSNSHLTQLASNHSTYELLLITVETAVPISEHSAFITLDRK
jgi:hypothetical protein